LLTFARCPLRKMPVCRRQRSQPNDRPHRGGDPSPVATPAPTHKEKIMTLDDVFGPEEDRFPLEQDAADWDLELEWDDEEAAIAAQYGRECVSAS
jgi:hypothetical protein